MIFFQAGGRTATAGILALFSVAVSAIVLSGCGGKPGEPQQRGGTVRPGFAPQQVDAQGAPADFPAPPERLTPQDEARNTIEEYTRQIEAEPDNPDTPARLMAMGNLYKQKLLDFEQAAVQYRELTARFPDYPQVGLAYIELADCLEKLNDWRSAQLVYREMMEHFPPDSQEYLFAQQKQGQ